MGAQFYFMGYEGQPCFSNIYPIFSFAQLWKIVYQVNILILELFYSLEVFLLFSNIALLSWRVPGTRCQISVGAHAPMAPALTGAMLL